MMAIEALDDLESNLASVTSHDESVKGGYAHPTDDADADANDVIARIEATVFVTAAATSETLSDTIASAIPTIPTLPPPPTSMMCK